MNKLLILLLFFISFSILCYSQNQDSTLIKVNKEVENYSIISDSLLYLKQLKDLQDYFFIEAYTFYELSAFTDEIFLSYFENKELDAYAFNPSILKIKTALNNLKTNFEIWDISYSQSSIISKTNYNAIKSNFLKAYNILVTPLNSNCNRIKNCDEIKSKIKESKVYIDNTIVELIKFLKL